MIERGLSKQAEPIPALSGESERRHSHIEALLAKYPALSADELDELLEWFEREASAYDVAVVASNEAIRDAYTRFRAEHVDALKLTDLARAIVFVVVAGAALAGVVWLAG